MGDKSRFDIAVVGGGLAGGLAAVALGRNGFRVALVDAIDPASMLDEAYDGRTTALAYAASRLYRRLGLWDDIADAASPINDILVSDGDAPRHHRDGAVSSLAMHFDSRTLESGEPLGYIVENRRLRLALARALAGLAEAVTVLAPATWTDVRFGDPAAELSLADGRRLSASLIVAADGKQSRLRGEGGIKVNRWNYPQTAIIATVAHARPHDGVAQELFLPSGPFAILPMTDDATAPFPNRSSIVWTEKAAAAPAYLALDDDSFLAALARRFGDYLGELALAGPRAAHPLSFHLSQKMAAPRLALLGDAARAIHPIAGQGYNLGVKDVAALVDVLVDARGVGLDIGSMATLLNYEKWRSFDSASLALGTDILNRLFSNDLAPLRIARRLGLGAVQAAAPLRQMFMRQAGADFGDLPSLLRG